MYKIKYIHYVFTYKHLHLEKYKFIFGQKSNYFSPNKNFRQEQKLSIFIIVSVPASPLPLKPHTSSGFIKNYPKLTQQVQWMVSLVRLSATRLIISSITLLHVVLSSRDPSLSQKKNCGPYQNENQVSVFPFNNFIRNFFLNSWKAIITFIVLTFYVNASNIIYAF